MHNINNGQVQESYNLKNVPISFYFLYFSLPVRQDLK
jgi:hypothetical protein